MILGQTLPLASIRGKDMWKVGFHFCSLSMIQDMSGLVDIKDIYWLHDERVLIFVVESLDRTHSLFRSEGLTAKKVGGHMPTGQPIMVKGPQQSATYGGDQCLRN